jgi:hypothetical protein
MTEANCMTCGVRAAKRYLLVDPGGPGDPTDEREFLLCARCARAERKRLAAQPPPAGGLTRGEFIEALDRFFASSAVFEVCRRCHEQGTGCCPPTCRVMGANGCDPNNRYGKTVFCGIFVCGALLNAISECDPETARALKRMKTELGAAEFHIYEMITRVPRREREPARPLALPRRYPQPVGLENGGAIREKLLALAPEVLEIRRRWGQLERQEADCESK